MGVVLDLTIIGIIAFFVIVVITLGVLFIPIGWTEDISPDTSEKESIDDPLDTSAASSGYDPWESAQ